VLTGLDERLRIFLPTTATKSIIKIIPEMGSEYKVAFDEFMMYEVLNKVAVIDEKGLEGAVANSLTEALDYLIKNKHASIANLKKEYVDALIANYLYPNSENAAKVVRARTGVENFARKTPRADISQIINHAISLLPQEYENPEPAAKRKPGLI
jgi:hypothetical protein